MLASVDSSLIKDFRIGALAEKSPLIDLKTKANS